MRYSEKTDQLFAALAEFQADLTPPPKNRTVLVKHKDGGQHSFAYAELGVIWVHISSIWRKGGFFWVSDTHFEGTRLILTTRIGHKSGQWFESDSQLAVFGDSKLQAGEITYWRRYAFSMMMGISSQEDAEEIPGQVGNRGREPREPNPPREQRKPQITQKAPSQPNSPSQDTGAGKAPQEAARITPATAAGSSGSAGAPRAQASATSQPPVQPVQRPGQKEREAIADLAATNGWPLQRIPEYLKHAHHVDRVEHLTMEQYADLVKVISGPMKFEEVLELIKPKPGDFGYVGPSEPPKPEPGSNG